MRRSNGGGGKSKKWKSFQTVFLYKKSSLNRTIRYVEMFGVILFIVFGAKFFLPRFVFPSIFFLFQPGCCRWPNTFPLPLKNFPFYRQYRYVRSFIRQLLLSISFTGNCLVSVFRATSFNHLQLLSSATTNPCIQFQTLIRRRVFPRQRPSCVACLQ